MNHAKNPGKNSSQKNGLMNGKNCFINGKILPWENANIHINDLGLLRSYAVFDYLRTYNCSLFRIDDYLHRFRNSAKAINLPLDQTDSQIKKHIIDLLKKQDQDVGIRLLLTGGYTSDSMSIIRPNFIILIEQLFHYPDDIFSKGVKLMTCEFQRFLPKVKTSNYLNAILLQPKKEKAKAFELLYHREGIISETARNNFFIVKNGILITPSDNILFGITRKVVLEIAKKNKLKVIETKLSLSELKDAEEAFITGSSKGIVPVVKIDKLRIGTGKVGNMTKKLTELFNKETLQKNLALI